MEGSCKIVIKEEDKLIDVGEAGVGCAIVYGELHVVRCVVCRFALGTLREKSQTDDVLSVVEEDPHLVAVLVAEEVATLYADVFATVMEDDDLVLSAADRASVAFEVLCVVADIIVFANLLSRLTSLVVSLSVMTVCAMVYCFWHRPAHCSWQSFCEPPVMPVGQVRHHLRNSITTAFRIRL